MASRPSPTPGGRSGVHRVHCTEKVHASGLPSATFPSPPAEAEGGSSWHSLESCLRLVVYPEAISVSEFKFAFLSPFESLTEN